MMEALHVLEVVQMAVRFGGVQAVDAVDLALKPGSRVGVIGPNGAGKSTLLNCISGYTRPDRGDVRLGGESVRRLPPHVRARRGMARTFQNLALFESMSVYDNVRTALDRSPIRRLSYRRPAHRPARQAAVLDILSLFEIESYAQVRADALPYGVRKLVELGRAMVCEPQLLLLDEPVAGVNDKAAFIEILIRALDERETTVLLIEHHMPTVAAVCEFVHVMDSGKVIARGGYHEIARNPDVLEAYLGTPETDIDGSVDPSRSALGSPEANAAPDGGREED
jgi:branched-chain amino acid transport system ATP-binding protein